MITRLFIILSLLAVAACATTETATRAEREPALTQFAPAPSVNTRLDYEVWDELLSGMVFSFGQSLRTRAGSPPPKTGSNLTPGHNSPYRLEGNRVVFSLFTDEYKALIVEYRIALEDIGNEIDITTLSRNEQLAYWLNLHNALMIETIAVNYPIKQPHRLLFGDPGVPLDDAKLVTIQGVPLSLRDIRERIVYPHWDDPLVIYGFFRGNIGGPSIHREAYGSSNITRNLRSNATEFVNSLRGVSERTNTIDISQIYYEAAPWYFPDFDADVKAHLARYATADVTEILENDRPLRKGVYEYDIADLAGGVEGGSSYYVVDALSGQEDINIDVPQTVTRLLKEFENKIETANRRRLFEGRPRGTVTIIDGDIDEVAPEID
ncbi:DUF547 domain-containing protein [Parvularcula flava]|nr:DUF547 domain-containing protein [Aquisalinus luteolus]NHK27374.1 DUF547 domain-containing protein [Aquisalinus luteolus]